MPFICVYLEVRMIVDMQSWCAGWWLSNRNWSLFSNIGVVWQNQNVNGGGKHVLGSWWVGGVGKSAYCICEPYYYYQVPTICRVFLCCCCPCEGYLSNDCIHWYRCTEAVDILLTILFVVGVATIWFVFSSSVFYSVLFCLLIIYESDFYKYWLSWRLIQRLYFHFLSWLYIVSYKLDCFLILTTFIFFMWMLKIFSQ